MKKEEKPRKTSVKERTKHRIKKIKHRTYKLLTSLVFVVLASGTIFYHYLEGWSWLDSLYFSLITLTTIGYGDLTPTLPITKIFTMVYAVMGIGIIFGFIGNLFRDENTA